MSEAYFGPGTKLTALGEFIKSNRVVIVVVGFKGKLQLLEK